MTEFVALSYSPWSEKARWPLEHHGIEFREHQYVPLLGAPRLRLRLRRLRGRVTVPVLFTRDRVLADSFAIAT